jgi:hypothetical protein
MMDILEWSLGLGGWMSLVAFACIAHTGNLDAVRYVLFIGVPIVAVSVTYAILSIAWQLLIIVLWAITLMFRRDILFTVVTVGILAAISATIHNLYTKLTEEEESKDFLAPLRTLCKLGKLAYERTLPGWYQLFLLIKTQPRLLALFEATRASIISERTAEATPQDSAETTTEDSVNELTAEEVTTDATVTTENAAVVTTEIAEAITETAAEAATETTVTAPVTDSTPSDELAVD